MTLDEALAMAIEFGWAEVDSVDRSGEQSSVGRCEALRLIEEHRAHLATETAAIQKARDQLACSTRPDYEVLAALDAILEGRKK